MCVAMSGAIATRGMTGFKAAGVHLYRSVWPCVATRGGARRGLSTGTRSFSAIWKLSYWLPLSSRICSPARRYSTPVRRNGEQSIRSIPIKMKEGIPDENQSLAGFPDVHHISVGNGRNRGDRPVQSLCTRRSNRSVQPLQTRRGDWSRPCQKVSVLLTE